MIALNSTSPLLLYGLILFVIAIGLAEAGLAWILGSHDEEER